MDSIESTITTAKAAQSEWDIVVIGAGPAGAVAGRELASRGCRVLIVDKAQFPRDKVCGGCVNAAALGLLDLIGLGDLPDRLGGQHTRSLLLCAHGRRAELPVPGGTAVSRRALDAGLLRAAILAGAEFLGGANARIQPGHEQVSIDLAGQTVRARVALAADGLAGTSLRACSFVDTHIDRHSRIGAAANLGPVDRRVYPSGVIYMACHRRGYVGAVRVEDDALNLAAALDPRFVQDSGGLAAAVGIVLESAGLPAPDGLMDASFHGTALLSVRRRPVACGRVFLIGDTAEYVEPFTGEGMAWAVASAVAIAPLLAEAARHWRPELAEAWRRSHRALIHRRSLRCRAMILALRHRVITRPVIRLLGRLPQLARPVIHEIAVPFHLAEA